MVCSFEGTCGSRASAIREKKRVNLVKKAVVLFVTSVGKKRNLSRPRALDPLIMKFRTLMLYHSAFGNSDELDHCWIDM